MPNHVVSIGITPDRHGHWILKAFRGPEELPGHATVDIDGNTTRHMLEAGLNRLLARHPNAVLSIEVTHEMSLCGLILDTTTRRVRRIPPADVAPRPP